MKADEMKRILTQVRIVQQKYTLAAEKARWYDMMISLSESEAVNRLASEYHRQAAALEAEMIAARKIAEKYVTLLKLQSEREVITRRYLMCQSWEKIADMMCYSERQVIRIHNKALEKMSLNVTDDKC